MPAKMGLRPSLSTLRDALPVATRILKALETRIATLDDPRSLGAPLKGEHEGYWRWRIDDYRVVARIEGERITILVVRVAHRREVYP